MEQTVWLIYLTAAAIALVVEFFTNKMYAIWFCFGGIIASGLAGFGTKWYITLAVFFGASFLLMLILRKPMLRSLNGESKRRDENVIGKEFRLLTRIGVSIPGTIRVNDVEREAYAENPGDEIEEGAIVVVTETRGIGFVVKETR